MSHNIQAVKELYDLFASKDFEQIKPLFHKKIKWNQMKGFPNGGEYVGADEIFSHVFKDFKEEWTDWKADVQEFLDAGDDVIVVGKYKGTFKKSGKQLEADFIHRYTFQQGVITKFKQYTDTALFAAAMKGGPRQNQANNPLHGVRLDKMLDYLVDEYGWDGLAKRININCFKSNQTKKSSLNFLRKFDWAREEVEFLYLKSIKN